MFLRFEESFVVVGMKKAHCSYAINQTRGFFNYNYIFETSTSCLWDFNYLGFEDIQTLYVQ